MSSLPHRGSRIVLVAVVALLGAACAHRAAPGVTAQVLQADVVFGAKTAPVEPTASAPPNALPPQSATANETTAPPLASLAPLPLTIPPLTIPVSAPASSCPMAGPTAFPKTAATYSVPLGSLPAVGTYRWKRQGTVTATSGRPPTNVDGFETRRIDNVIQLAPVSDPSTGEKYPSFRYDTTQPDLLTGSTVTRTWQVEGGGLVIGPNDAPILPEGIATSQIPTVTPPEQGLALASQVTTAADGTTSTFSPVTPLLLFPFPVSVGQTFTSTAIDPDTFASMTYADATVLAQQRVDACGAVVEGWGVTGLLEYTSPSGAVSSFTLTMVVVPQMGSILAAESINQKAGGGTGEAVDWTIGQVNPSPLPVSGS